MSLYSLISSLLSYVFTTIIYLFIFSVIALIYMDIKRMNRSTDSNDGELPEESAEDEYEHTARLSTVETEEAAKSGMKTYYRIGEEPTIVGRDKSCDITVNDMFLSQEHFQIWFEDGVWYIADLGSKNGTLLNGKPLKNVETLSSGDEISFGGVSVVFEEE